MVIPELRRIHMRKISSSLLINPTEKFVFPLDLGDKFDKHQRETHKYKPISARGELDLTTRDESDGSSRCKHVDLNDLSWA